jgi:hypothetical protein
MTEAGPEAHQNVIYPSALHLSTHPGISHHLVKPQNMGSPPTREIDAALPPASRAYGPEGEMGRNLGVKENSLLLFALLHGKERRKIAC